ncbi:hypothetical protein NQ314_014832 [Rhamnusium bicolor]|uniref:Uncharacterized protein n=1 Tax=Rhamnusium bicolor TaxID=1586634 RepID=A0AAV8X0Y8_9CUCU|nr:hypothetical protein NQ314_014832 [Rhamnusium bicolor]
MSGKSRGAKMIEMCKVINKSASVNFWHQRKKSNWFCNRALSPPPDSSTIVQVGSSYNEENNSRDIIQSTKENIANLDLGNITKENENNEQIPSDPEDPFYTLEGNEYCPSVEEKENIANLESGNITKENENNELIPSDPEDPFYTSEGSEYCPSAEEGKLSPPLLSSVIPNSTETKKDITLSAVQNSQTKLSNSKTPYKRKPDHCYYCETEVQNFGRHVKRNHSTEVAVIEILSKPNNSKERRNLLDKLRRQGNFLASGKGNFFKPVRQPDVPNRSLLPCDNCLGFFSCKLLYRHRKKCLGDQYKSGKSQSAGQSKLVINKRVDKRLAEEVFPHMRADKVSLEAKNDTLICGFGARYINTHREKHFVQVASRKMRELSKILIEMRKLDPNITDMFSALQPKYFDLFVQAVKQVSKYDAEKDLYLSPTFAMNIATSLKQCCDIAITYAYKKSVPYLTISSGEVEANLKTLIHLFTSNWRFEVSSQAASNLSLNKWNKVTVIPLATDLRLLRQYLIHLAENAIKKLNEKKDTKSYNDLIESVYCRVILLNRKRSGELQRMPLDAYKINTSEKQGYEEFNKVVSSAEQILLKTLKRVVIRGKRGKGVPVLFSSDVQEHINTLLDVRDNFVPKKNIYFFAKVNSITHITGYKILSKHAINCGAKNPSSITSTRLRKHLATLSQLFSLSDNEIEQLATFMGHTPGVHRNSYRLPDDVYQTAKISKLLMIMEKGGANEYRGKTLDEVNIDMEENLLDSKSDEDDADDDIVDVLPEPVPSTSATVAPTIPLQKKRRILVPWTSEQKKVARFFFKEHIKYCKPPKREECDELKEKHSDLLQNKHWLKIKVFIQNEYTKKKKL